MKISFFFRLLLFYFVLSAADGWKLFTAMKFSEYKRRIKGGRGTSAHRCGSHGKGKWSLMKSEMMTTTTTTTHVNNYHAQTRPDCIVETAGRTNYYFSIQHLPPLLYNLYKNGILDVVKLVLV